MFAQRAVHGYLCLLNAQHTALLDNTPLLNKPTERGHPCAWSNHDHGTDGSIRKPQTRVTHKYGDPHLRTAYVEQETVNNGGNFAAI